MNFEPSLKCLIVFIHSESDTRAKKKSNRLSLSVNDETSSLSSTLTSNPARNNKRKSSLSLNISKSVDEKPSVASLASANLDSENDKDTSSQDGNPIDTDTDLNDK